jgi:hypothetical protein
VGKDTLDVDLDKLLQNVYQLNLAKALDVKRLRNEVLLLIGTDTYDRLQVCCGHDVAAVLALGLKKVLGNHRDEVANQENVERLLRLSYDTTDFASTRLYGALKCWEGSNKPFKLFSPPL